MLKFNCAYMNVNGMMDFAEAMIKESVQKATGGSLQVKYGENEIDFSNFEKLTMREAIIRHLPKTGGVNVDETWFYDELKLGLLSKVALFEWVKTNFDTSDTVWGNAKIAFEEEKSSFNGIDETQQANIIVDIFERVAEENLIQPTFIVDYPKSISPLSKASPQNPQIAERFELFIAGMECANGFSELNDPQEQYERFLDQAKERERGDEEAMVLDEDYIRALSYGMPPAAGIGIGIDRLVMLLKNRQSIRDVILFPHMRPERGKAEEQENE